MRSHEYLKQIFDEKKKHNPRLSLRSIARKVKIPSGRLSEILAGKRRLTADHLEKICASLNLKTEENEKLRHYFQIDSNQESSFGYDNVLSHEQVSRLADWKPFAFMSFLQTQTYAGLIQERPQSKEQISQISQKMGISDKELQSLVELMVQLKLLTWDKNRWLTSHSNASTGFDIPNKAIQAAHAVDLELARKKIFECEIGKRDYSSITLSIDPNDIPKAKRLIRAFRRKFAHAMEKDLTKDVYQISIQFFPLIESE